MEWDEDLHNKLKHTKINGLIVYYNNQLKYLNYIKQRLSFIFPIFLLIMIVISSINSDLNYLIMAIYFCCVINIIQDYNIFHTLGTVITRIKRRRYLYKKLKQRKKQ